MVRTFLSFCVLLGNMSDHHPTAWRNSDICDLEFICGPLKFCAKLERGECNVHIHLSLLGNLSHCEMWTGGPVLFCEFALHLMMLLIQSKSTGFSTFKGSEDKSIILNSSHAHTNPPSWRPHSFPRHLPEWCYCHIASHSEFY